MEPLKQIVNKTSLTTHDRVLKETSLLATELAKKLNCTKLELYSWLVKWGVENEGGAMIEALARDELQISHRKDTEK